jgi:hypothetical protein
MSTLRESGRDWVDLWVSPYEDHLQLAVPDKLALPDLEGAPKNGLNVRLDFTANRFIIEVYKNGQLTHTATGAAFNDWLTESPTRRDTFQLTLTRTSASFTMPGYGKTLVETTFADLGWSTGVVQLGQHSYNPTKDTTISQPRPGTRHWDNVRIEPAVPFTIIRSDGRALSASKTVATLESPAPANAYVRFTAIGPNIQVRFNGGQWIDAVRKKADAQEEHFESYWTPVPQGTTTVEVRGQNWWGGAWYVRDLTVWAR